MIEDIINGIAAKLKDLFPQKNIYDENIEQGYEEPCFFIIYEDDDESRFPGNRYGIELHFRIIYFQDFSKRNNDLYSTRNILKLEFQYIEYKNFKYRITEKHFEKQDKDLHFTFTIKVQMKNRNDNENSFSDIDIAEERKEK